MTRKSASINRSSWFYGTRDREPCSELSLSALYVTESWSSILLVCDTILVCLHNHKNDSIVFRNQSALSAFSDTEVAMGLVLSGKATVTGRLEAEDTITNAIKHWADAIGKFADIGKQLPGTMQELAGIGKGLPRK